MGISVFPAPAGATSTSPGQITVAATNTLNSILTPLPAGVYRIDLIPTTSQVTVEFYTDATTLLVSTTTGSGTVTLNIGSTCDRVRLWVVSGGSTQVTITRVADALTNSASAVLDTILASTTYTGTSTSGCAYVALVGAGGGGGGCNATVNAGGGGGASGAIVRRLVALTGSMPLVIGAAGAGGAAGPNNGGTGGNTTFAGLTANGGPGGTAGTAALPNGLGGVGVTPTGGTFNTRGANGGNGGPSATGGQTPGAVQYPFIVDGTTGGGGGGSNASTTTGSGSGIGTGGNGGNNSVGADGSGTGGSGGGGGGTNNSPNARAGGAGTPGVVYILRF